jgi:hypothetical protein
MKSPRNYSLLTKAVLLVSLGLFIGGATIARTAEGGLFIDPKHPGTLSYSNGPTDGYLLVYSSTDEFNDGGLALYAHSSYVIYTIDGKFLRNIENHMSRSDELPELVRLCAGSYTIEARSADDGYVRVHVVIRPGQQTTLYLDGGV